MKELSLDGLSLQQDASSILQSFSPLATREQIGHGTLSLIRLAGVSVGVAESQKSDSIPSSSKILSEYEKLEREIEKRLMRRSGEDEKEEEEGPKLRLSALRALDVLVAAVPDKCAASISRLLPDLLSNVEAALDHDTSTAASDSPEASTSLGAETIWSSAELQSVAQLFSSLCSHANFRKLLSQSSHFVQWACDVVDAAELQHSPPSSVLARAALAVGLSLLKLSGATPMENSRGDFPPSKVKRRATGVEEEEEIRTEGVQAKGESEAEKELKRKEEAELRTSVRALAKAQLIDSLSHGPTSLPIQHISEAQRESLKAFIEELRDSAHMLALEALAHLASDPQEKVAIIADDELLQALCSSELGPIKSLGARRAVFPSRGSDVSGSSTQARTRDASSYAVDPYSAQTRADGAAIYALASLFGSLAAYPPVLSAQEKQMLALRCKASGASPPAEESPAVLETRMLKLVATGAGQQLTRLSIAAVSAGTEKGTSATRIAVGLSLLGLTTPQDRKVRAKLVQDGCARALLSLSSSALPIVTNLQEPASAGSMSTQDKDALLLAPLQALARLCISLPPQLMFPLAVAPLQSIAALFLSPASNALQRFEACLALTNLASLPELAATVAKSRLDRSASTNASASKLQEPHSVTVSEALYDRIASPNLLERRAAVELVCNLCQDESVAAQWNGEVEDERASTSNRPISDLKVDIGKSAATARIHILLALCAVCEAAQEEGTDAIDAAQERKSALPLRLAASAALAALLSSPSGCKRLLHLRPRSLNILARLLQPGTSVRAAKISALEEEEEQEEGEDSETRTSLSAEEEIKMEEEDAKVMPHPLGPVGARRDLRTRALACIGCLGQYATWLADTHETAQLHQVGQTLAQSGIVDAVLGAGKRLREMSEEERSMWREIIEHFRRGRISLDQARE
ncbi:hypothetical protein IE81DRAFT_344516 [Ceraceosorus guamensis]|uniref:UNC-45/Cro1/She4 central domain-containing protein n=1 Tax=Ceraceosorus guamensis TaxID=1522189 RepID=A0A316W979_9BASI|nr:hypothetical protein IE81DRAFT_344516 [Ceraceosorus guamensis]PWN45618.1 hypothetical protein IE81DRAFT_344516 [Ceraceosorus guamensis]